MKLEIKQLENQLMNSNCFIIVDNGTKSCVIIDPASEKAEKEIEYIHQNSLRLDYIILTHTHADHCWGVNVLKQVFHEANLVYHDDEFQKREIMLFFRMWHEDENYSFDLNPADILLKDNQIIDWCGHNIRFVWTPGHSEGSLCIDIEGQLFTGDTIMPFPPYFNGRGSDKEEWKKSIIMIESLYGPDTMIYPGHGDMLTMGEWLANDDYTRCK